MVTAEYIMDYCWSADLPYADMIRECIRYNIRVPTEAEYSALCARAESDMQDWHDTISDYDSDDQYYSNLRIDDEY